MVLTINGERYSLGGRLGDGAVGIVRKAFRSSDGAPFAIKFLAPDPKYIDEDVFDDVATRFKREGERGAQLSHPHLVEIKAYVENESGSAFAGRVPANPFILMEWVRGKTLESYLRALPAPERGHFLPDEERLQIAIQVARALDYLHRRLVVHRDVKPANVLMTASSNTEVSWHAKLGDFGVVKWGEFQASIATGTLTMTHQQGLGTLKYMAPEQALNPKGVTVRTDIFSLGITLLELVTGRILPSPHHVFGVMSARLDRNKTTSARFDQLGIRLPYEFSDLGDLILDMHLRGASGRPAIRKVLGHLEYQYSTIFQRDMPKL